MTSGRSGWQAMKLNEIRDNPGAHYRAKRVGRGIGSGKGKTSGARRQGPDGAHRRRAQRLRGRPDAAASPAAEARLQQQDLPQGFQGRESRPAAAGARCRQAERRRARSTRKRWCRRGCCGGSATASACWPRASCSAAMTIEVAGASKAAIAAVEAAGGKVVLPAGAAAAEPGNGTPERQARPERDEVGRRPRRSRPALRPGARGSSG